MEFGFGAVGALAFGDQGLFQVGGGGDEAVAGVELEFVEVARRDVEGALEVQVFFGQVEGVDAVEYHRVVAGAGDQGFPGLVAVPRSLDQQDPRPPAVEVHAAQHGFFVAFDVDLEEVDGAVDVGFTDIAQGARADDLGLHRHAGVLVLLGDGGVEGGQAGVGDAVEGQGLGVVAGCALQVAVPGALLAQGVVIAWHRFDVDPAPATVVEGAGHGVGGGVVGADVDVEAFFDMLERAPQADVFEILCIRNERHCLFPSVTKVLARTRPRAPASV